MLMGLSPTGTAARLAAPLICFASGAHAIPPRFMLAGASAPGRVEDPPRAGIIGQSAIQLPACFSRGREWASQVSRRPILCFCLGLRRRPNRCSLASGGLTGAAPAAARAKASACYRFRGYRGASAPAVYASRVMLPSPMQDSLPAGWLAFSGRESNPLDRVERFPTFYISSPSPGFIPTRRCSDPVRFQRHFAPPQCADRKPAPTHFYRRQVCVRCDVG
jgi:hypothetical protein